MAKQAIPGAKRGELFRLDDPWRVTIIGLDTDDSTEHPYYCSRIERDIPESFVINLLWLGNIEPVQVIKDGKHDSGPYAGQDRLIVVAGRRRVRGLRKAVEIAKARALPIPLLTVEVKRGNEELLQGIMISENAHTESDDVVTRAINAARLHSMGRDLSWISLHFGVGSGTIRDWLRIAELTPTVHGAIRRGDISASAAAKLAGLDRAEQVKRLDALIESARANGKKRPTVSDAERGAVRSRPRAILPKAVVRELAADEDFTCRLSADAIGLLRVFLGEKDAIDVVPGLAAWLEGSGPK